MADQPHVDFNEVIARSQATTLDGMGKMFALSGDLQRGIFTKHADQLSGDETAAQRQLMHREAPLNPTSSG